MMPSYVRNHVRAGAWSSLPCFLLAIAACGAVAFGQAAAPAVKPQAQYRITGALVSSVDGSPVPHGHLEATLAGSGRMAGQHTSAGDNEADTDDQGRFVILLPTAGMWDLTASARGFVRQGYQEHDQFATAVVLTSAAPAMDIRFALSPNAEIGGVVTDEAGEAVRGAQVSLIKMRVNVPGDAEPPMTMSRSATTDDRGMYEFDDLTPGNYRVCVQAQPWYAVAAGRRVRSDREPPLDPSLDVAYSPTWFPGTDDPNAAEMLTVKGGDVREADVRLTPVPSVHILVDPPPSTAPGASRGGYMPTVQRISSNAGPAVYIQPTVIRNAQGQFDVSGLTPGLYEVQSGGPDGESSAVRVTADRAQTVSFGADSGEAKVSFHIDGLPEEEAGSLQVVLVDPVSRQAVASSNARGGNRAGFRRLRGAAATDGKNAREAQERPPTLSAPAGRYEVVILGRPDLYLTGIAAKGAQATGRAVTLPAGGSSLTLHLAEGRATLTGFATLKGKPSVGSVVMLVPATLGETGALQIVRRDQSNSDGSFNIAQIVPGQYILIAVENGWEINWADAGTLRRYLTGGIPVDLAAGSDAKQDIVAQEP